MKKSFALLVVCMLVIGLLAGCGGGDKKPAAPAAPAAPLTYDQFQHELQKMALLGAHQSGKVETADSVLASIINPPASTEGEK